MNNNTFLEQIEKKKEKEIFCIILIITFTIFVMTASGHRFTPDEYYAYNQASAIIHQTKDPNFIAGETRPGLQGVGFITASRGVCYDNVLCSLTPIGHAITLVPFIVIEEQLKIIPDVEYTNDDFDDPHYVYWRNSLDKTETFTFLFYGPIISAISVAVLFLIVRTYNYSLIISTIVAMLYAFTTLAWAYSSTGFTVVGGTLLILVGFLYYRKFCKEQRLISLIIAGFALGFSVAIRYDMLFFVVIVFGFVIYEIIKMKKIKKIAGFIIPLILWGLVLMSINQIRFGSVTEFGYGSEEGFIAGHTTPFYVGVFGLLFSPGVGMFVFSPILLTIFVSFRDFYKTNKQDIILILIYLVVLLVFFGTFHAWHGLVSWGSRYMVSIMPFLLLPLAATLKKRKAITKSMIVGLGSLGVLFNLSWLVQDVGWFVWGVMGGDKGLFSLGNAGMHPLRLNPVVFWTFENSQLTHSLQSWFTNLQMDLFIVKALGVTETIVISSIIIIPSSIYLIKLLGYEIKNDIKNKSKGNSK